MSSSSYGGGKPSNQYTDMTAITHECNASDTRTIVIVLDTTASMGSSLNAIKCAIGVLGEMLKIIKINLIVILYGDYTSGRDTPYTPITIYKGDIEDIIYKLSCYKLNQNGFGGDGPEALITALNIAHYNIPDDSHIIIITDNVYHGYSYSSFGYMMCDDGKEGDWEHKILKKNDMKLSFNDISNYLFFEKDVTIDIITNYSHADDAFSILSQKGGCICNSRHSLLSEEYVTESLFILLKIRISNPIFPPGVIVPHYIKLEEQTSIDVSKGSFNIHFENHTSELKYYESFVRFVRSNPEYFPYLNFLAEEYFKIVRKYKKSAEHSLLCQFLLENNINKVVIDWFKEEGSPKMLLNELNCQHISSDSLALSKSHSIGLIDFMDMLKFVNFFPGKTSIRNLKKIIKGFNLININSPDFNPETCIVFDAIKGEGNINFLASFICCQENILNEFHSFNPIIASAILQWCDIDVLRNIVKDYIKTSTFMNWTNAGNNVPDSMFHAPTLNFVVQGLSPHETNCNKTSLHRLSKGIMIAKLLSNSYNNINTIIERKNMSQKEIVRHTPGVYMVWCFLCANWMPINLMKAIDLSQFNAIGKSMQTYINTHGFNRSPMFKRFGTVVIYKEYMIKIQNIIKEIGSMYVSIYAINFGLNDTVGLPFMDIHNNIDEYTYKPSINGQIKPHDEMIGMEYGSMIEYYIYHIGRNGENLITEGNMVDNCNVLPDGPRMVSCTKAGKAKGGRCGNIYQILDTSSGAIRLESTCASCRKNVNVYSSNCTDCGHGISMAHQLDDFNSTNCIFCRVKEGTKTYSNVQVNILFKENISAISRFLGVSSEYISRLISKGHKPARAFRDEKVHPENPEMTVKFFPEFVFDDTQWVNEPMPEIVTIYGCTITPESIEYIKESIVDGFTSDCPFCCETCPIKETLSCTNCQYRFCKDCAKSMYNDDVFKHNATISNSNFSCPACRAPITKGVARSNKFMILHSAIKHGIVSQVMANPNNEMKICGNPECEAPTRAFCVEKGVCGAAGDEDGGAANEDPTIHDYVECHHCLSSRKIKELAAEKAAQEGVLNPDCFLPTGHYITEDGLVCRVCQYCGTLGTRLDNHCWNMTCTNPDCGMHYCWADGYTGDDIYGHLTKMFGTFYVSGSEHVDPRNRNLFISTVDGQVDFNSWTPEQLEALEMARSSELGNTDYHNGDDDDEDGDNDGDNDYQYGGYY